MAEDARAETARILLDWLKTGRFPDRLVAGVRSHRGAVMEMVYGTVRYRRMLEWVVSGYAKRRPGTDVMAHLLSGLYEILVMDTVPDHAAVNEAVGRIRRACGSRSAGFANAVLRGVVRDKRELRARMAVQPLGIRESHPDALVKRWERTFGAARAESLCRWNNTRPSVTIRPCRARHGVDDFRGMLLSSGVAAEPHPFRPEEFLVLPHGVSVPGLPGYDEGLFTVQDPSTAVAVEILAPEPGESILDSSAAPGGKTLLIAERMRAEGHLVAMDLHEDRLPALRENLDRAGLAGAVDVRRGDATNPRAALRGSEKFDGILLDVPCTNTGVLRRRPDARWRFSRERLAELTALQRRMLAGVAPLLRPGGRAVYSTCSLEPEEGRKLVDSWLSASDRFSLEVSVALFPPDSRTDGIFAARIVRRAG